MSSSDWLSMLAHILYTYTDYIIKDVGTVVHADLACRSPATSKSSMKMAAAQMQP